ncbi:MAG: hypothetical protein HY544_00670 [Candidatus Diapherotrites archaeon]|uniref:Uncharacterized protein n=1 Tax=Candidatus Iainarchaeum sp. TaxID=3101447 RepID=A0A8T3YIY0_9ARCH|nr:hypothetical protein [Candidatus Diapherotrites archaeon]
MPIETLDEIVVPAPNPQRPEDARKQALEALNLAFELAGRKVGLINLSQIHLKFHRHFTRENIAALGKKYQVQHGVSLGLFGKKGMIAQLEYMEIGVREFLQELSRANAGKKVAALVVNTVMPNIVRSLGSRGARMGELSPAGALKIFEKVNSEMGHPVAVIASDLRHLGKLTGKAPRLSVRSRTNILRTMRHSPPR